MFQRKPKNHGHVVSLTDSYKNHNSHDDDYVKKNISMLSLLWGKTVIVTKTFFQSYSLKKVIGFVAFFMMLFLQHYIRSISFSILKYSSDRLLDRISYEILTQDLSPIQALWRGMRQEQVTTVVEPQRNIAQKERITSVMASTQTAGKDDDLQDNVISPPLELVISHCNQPLDWIFEDLTSDNVYFGDQMGSSIKPNIVNVTVFSKCDYPVKGIPPEQPYNVVRLPNVGRNDHSFASWLSQQHPSPHNSNNVVLFLKDNDNTYRHLGRQRPLREIIRIAQGSAGFGCREERFWSVLRPGQIIRTLWNGERSRIFRKRKPLRFFFTACEVSYFHYRTKLLNWKIGQYQRLRRDDESLFRSPYTDIGEWLQKAVFAGNSSDFSSFFSTSTSLIPVCYGGNFAARRSQISNNPQWLYRNLASSLERSNNIAESHFAERSWAALLSNPLSDDDKRALLDYQAEGQSSWCEMASPWPTEASAVIRSLTIEGRSFVPTS